MRVRREEGEATASEDEVRGQGESEARPGEARRRTACRKVPGWSW